MSSFPSYYTYDYVLEQYSEIIHSTKHLEAWYMGGPSISQTRDALLFLIGHAPSSVFDQFSDHSFWTTWRSKSSQQTSLSVHFALRNAKDVGWIEKLIPLFEDKDLDPSSLSEMAVSRFHAVPYITCLKERGLLTCSPSMLSHVAQYSSAETFKYLWEEGKASFQQRIEGVEASIIGRHSKKTDYPREEILNMIWKRWGHPPHHILHEMHKSVVSKHNPEVHAHFFYDMHNPTTPSWSDRDFLVYLRARTPRHMAEVKERLKDPLWVIPPHIVEEFLHTCPVRGETKQVLENLFLHQAIEQNVSTSFRPTTVKKM